MKHLSAEWWARAAAAADLRAEDDLRAQLRLRLDQPGGKAALARDLAITSFQLSGILRGRWPVTDEIAAKLGFRRVTRFERVE